MSIDAIKAAIRDIPDFPKEGIVFKDICPVLQNPALFKSTIELFEAQARKAGAQKIAAIDARGFIFAGAVCDRLNAGLVLVRKQGKLPFKTHEATYDLEYGSATLAIHQDAFNPGDKVMIIDDLLATGGTAAATASLVEQGGGQVVGFSFLIELSFLKGRDKLSGYPVYAPI